MVNEIEDRASIFVRSFDPMALMWMPGCYDVCVNKAHMRVFGERDLAVAASADEFRQYLGDRPSAARWREHSCFRICYCEKVKAVIALRTQHCVFESLFASLGKEKQWVSGLGFLNMKQRSDRRYDVFRVHCRQIINGGVACIETRLVPLPGFEVIVRSPNPAPGTPKELESGVMWDGRTWIRENVYQVENPGGYEDLETLLAEAEQKLESSKYTRETTKEWLLDEVQKIKTKAIDYEPVKSFARSLFEGEVGSDEMIRKIRMVRERLFDALVVVEHIRPRIEEALARTAEMVFHE